MKGGVGDGEFFGGEGVGEGGDLVGEGGEFGDEGLEGFDDDGEDGAVVDAGEGLLGIVGREMRVDGGRVFRDEANSGSAVRLLAEVSFSGGDV